MQTEYLIIGQGICGTWLSYYLLKEGRSVLVIDNNRSNAASRVAAGIINPVTGRRIVKTWMIDELLEFIVPAYKAIGTELGISSIHQRPLIDFHPTPQMKLAFDERINEHTDFLFHPGDQESYKAIFNFDFGIGKVNPCYIIGLNELLPGWRRKLSAGSLLIEEDFEIDKLEISGKAIVYKDINAEKIIFCDGIGSAQNPYFKNMPFALNKGEAIVIEASDIPPDHIFKKGMILTHLESNFYWVGSNYSWDFTDDNPSGQFRLQTESLLKNWLRVKFKIVDHKASVRPANVERRPFVGFHPNFTSMGILNGMGSKGCSLAPFFARQLAENIVAGVPILPEADIKRFSRILMKQN